MVVCITCIVATCTHLLLQLRSCGFHACGTLRLIRRGVPPEARVKLKKGEQRVIPPDDTMKVVQWHDKRVVSILSTIHSDATVPVERQSRHAKRGCEVVEKPKAFYLFDAAVVNGYILPNHQWLTFVS